MVVHGSPWGKPLADTDRRAPQRTNVDPRSIAGRARSIVLAEPRWLDIVTWRLIAAAIGVAVAFTLPYLPEPAVNPMARPCQPVASLNRRFDTRWLRVIAASMSLPSVCRNTKFGSERSRLRPTTAAIA